MSADGINAKVPHHFVSIFLFVSFFGPRMAGYGF